MVERKRGGCCTARRSLSSSECNVTYENPTSMSIPTPARFHSPRLNPVSIQLSIHARQNHRIRTRQEHKGPHRITPSIQVETVPILPVRTQRRRVCQTHLLAHRNISCIYLTEVANARPITGALSSRSGTWCLKYALALDGCAKTAGLFPVDWEDATRTKWCR